MDRLEKLERDVAKLKKLMRALAFKGAIMIDEDGDLVPATGPCIYEARAMDGNSAFFIGAGRAWCQTHGFDCPNMNPTK